MIRDLALIAVVICVFISLFSILSCQSTSAPKAYAAWSFSGYVIDGNTRQGLAGVLISYFDKDGAPKSATTDSSGSFFIDELPFGDRSFSFVYNSADTSAPSYTNRMIVVSSYNESRSIEGLMGDVSKVVSLFPLNGSVSGTVFIKRKGNGNCVPARNAALTIVYKDTVMATCAPSVFESVADSTGRFQVIGLPRAPGASLFVGNFSFNDIVYRSDAVLVQDLVAANDVVLGNIYLNAADSSSPVMNTIQSNVLSADGFGLSGVPVTVQPWYVVPAGLAPSSVTATLDSGRNCIARLSGDTIFVVPAKNFPYDTLITVTLFGIDSLGNRMELVLDGSQRFLTEKGIFATASNAWKTAGIPSRSFKPEDTIWVAFSEPLDPDVNKIQWSASSAQNAVYGKGSGANASVWVSSETLFVRPDQRLSVNYGQTMGFKVNVLSADGKRSDSLDVVADVVEDVYYVKWTNAKDLLGNMRRDFGVMESIVVVSNAPIAQVKGLSGITGKTVPPDLTLDNVRLSGDTIIYRPSLYLAPDSAYGLDFDVLFADNTMRYDALAVTWKTSLRIQMLSIDNKVAGAFRRMAVIGDSLSVVFSTAVDTSLEAAVPFRAAMKDVHSKTIRTLTHWNAECTRAVIYNIDTLPSADYNASPAYTGDAVNTRAIKSVTFDLTTREGERVLGFKPMGEDLEIHTEAGLCVVSANVVRNHDDRSEVDRTEDPVLDISPAASVIVSFNRAVDAAAMNNDSTGFSKFIGIRKGITPVAVAISLSEDARTITLTPDSTLAPSVDYFVWFKNVPGAGMAGAAAINKDAGSYSGRASDNSLLDRGFRVK